jgi:hypothetical protein
VSPGDHAISLPEIADIRPRSFHDTGGIHAGDEWKVEVWIVRACGARASFRIGWIDTRITDSDQHFTMFGSGIGTSFKCITSGSP